MTSSIHAVSQGLLEELQKELGETLGFVGQDAEEVRDMLRELARLYAEAAIMRAAGMDTKILEVALRGVVASVRARGAATAARRVQNMVFTIIRRSMEALLFAV